MDVVFKNDEEPDFGPVDAFIPGNEALPEGEDFFLVEEPACGRLVDSLITKCMKFGFHPLFPREQKAHFWTVHNLGGEEADRINKKFHVYMKEVVKFKNGSRLHEKRDRYILLKYFCVLLHLKDLPFPCFFRTDARQYLLIFEFLDIPQGGSF